MASNRCMTCVGSGKIMGGGMIYRECPDCNGEGTISPAEPKVTVNRRSKAYKDAIAKLEETGLSKDEAVKVFDEEFERL